MKPTLQLFGRRPPRIPLLFPPPRRHYAANGTILRRKQPFVVSPEQQAIVDLSRTENVVVSARPGAGKTATAEAIVAANPGRPIAVVTYSKRLQLETARRLKTYPACDVFTFHGIAGKLFNTVAYTDAVLRQLRAGRTAPTWAGRPYEIVILDELQDCTEQLYWLACTFVTSIARAAGRAPQIVALGDERQAIFDFMGADARFLSLCPAVLSTVSPYPWTRLPLSRSFRLSHQTSCFVNDIFLGGEQYITGSHDGPRPLYLHGSPYAFRALAARLHPLIEQYGPGNTAVLAPSVRSKGPLSLLTNHLSDDYGYQVAVTISDEQTLDDDVINGKICVSTYHQFKGLERDLVVVYGVDAGWFEYFGRDLPDDRCPNATFVALTRARRQLVVMHDSGKPPMPFASVARIPHRASYDDYSGEGMYEPDPPGRPPELGLVLPRTVGASDVVRHAPVEMLEVIVKEHLLVTRAEAPLPRFRHIDAPDKTLTDPERLYYEAVSDLNGIAVVAAYEHALFGTLKTLARKHGRGSPATEPPPASADPGARAAWLCREACEYEGLKSGYRSRHIQMQGHAFDWLGPYLDAAVERLRGQFADAGELAFEVPLGSNFEVEDGGRAKNTKINGWADIIRYDWPGGGGGSGSLASAHKRRAQICNGEADVSVWEIKFVAQLTVEHAIQACIYAYLWTLKHRALAPLLPRIVLFNVRDGEKWEMMVPRGLDGLQGMIADVLRARYTAQGRATTDAFLKMCEKARSEVEALR